MSDLQSLGDQLAGILGGKAMIENGVISVTNTRKLAVRLMGVLAKAPMVLNIEVAFQPINGTNPESKFLNTGEIVLLTREVEPFVRSITSDNVPITAVHNHWMFQEPDIWYAHWLAVMPPLDFTRITARALAAIEEVHSSSARRISALAPRAAR